MARKIELEDRQAQKFLEYLLDNKENLIGRIKDLQKELIEIEDMISRVRNSSEIDNKWASGTALIEYDVNSYKKSWSWPQKIKFALEKVNSVLTTPQILNILVNQGEDFNSLADRRIAITNLSATLSQRIKVNETFGRVSIENTTYYGLIEWFTANGTLKPEYLRRIP